MYRTLTEFGKKYIGMPRLLKWGFNFSPMYRRTTARVIAVSEDMTFIRIKIPISWKNKNYMGTVFGGSMFAAVDPIPMIQIMHFLGDDYIIWDKSATIAFKRPGKMDLYGDFTVTEAEIEHIKTMITTQKEMEMEKITQLTDKSGTTVICEVTKTIYIAEKQYYKAKLAARKAKSDAN